MNHNSGPNPSTDQPVASASIAMGVALSAAVLAVLLRTVPLPFVNLSMVGALGLYCGARLRPLLALALPLAVMAVSDVILWQLKDWQPFDPFVYGSFVIYVLLGFAVRQSTSVARIGGMCLLGTVQFFLITNAGEWLRHSVEAGEMPSGKAVVWIEAGSQYPNGELRFSRNVEGLVMCYLMGLPYTTTDTPAALAGNGTPFEFVRNLLLGDLLFCGLLFGVHAALAVSCSRRVEARVEKDR